MALSEHLEPLARAYWESWKLLRQNQGWTLGVDNGSAKMSPYLVHSFDALDDAGQQHFRQQTALVLHAVDELVGPAEVQQVATKPPADSHDKAVRKLGSAIKAMDEADWMVAERKVRTALKLLKGEPIRSKKA